MNKDPLSKTLTDALGEEEDISLTVAIYRHKDLQRYAARGSISSTASHLLTRGTDHLMNREVRAPKGEILPVPQASWRRNHDTEQIRT